jgi:hypothetical protein
MIVLPTTAAAAAIGVYDQLVITMVRNETAALVAMEDDDNDEQLLPPL